MSLAFSNLARTSRGQKLASRTVGLLNEIWYACWSHRALFRTEKVYFAHLTFLRRRFVNFFTCMVLQVRLLLTELPLRPLKQRNLVQVSAFGVPYTYQVWLEFNIHKTLFSPT
jgi:hypothetical protein